jgi:hypothetical protein
MSANRKLSRLGAREEYERDIKAWKRHQRATGNYGKSGVRKPTFEQWSLWKDQQKVMQTVPMQGAGELDAEIVKAIEGVDPWAE